jgi:nucleoside-diphosphate-sugar epimerase
MRIAFLGATSQIAKDLVLSFTERNCHELLLYARRPEVVSQWLASVGLASQIVAADFSDFKTDQHFDAVINFVGVGNPAQAAAMGATIFDVTTKYDEIALNYVQHHTECKYIFLSSGAAYCSNFDEPVNEKTKIDININNIKRQDWYGLAKMHAECRHRAQTQMSIVDVRVFNYFSHTQDMNNSFFITEIIQALRNGTVLKTSEDYFVRDYMHPSDFYTLINSILCSTKINIAVDCYTKAPIDNINLLNEMKKQFRLKYTYNNFENTINATGRKKYYYSKNHAANIFSYVPKLNSIDGIMLEAQLILSM